MILCLKTADPTAVIVLADANKELARDEWRADRTMARGLLARIESVLRAHGLGWQDVSGVVAFQGPGSFTSLRIGLTTANAIAYSRSIPIVAAEGDDWITRGLRSLSRGETDHMVLPTYGAEPCITSPRK